MVIEGLQTDSTTCLYVILRLYENLYFKTSPEGPMTHTFARIHELDSRTSWGERLNSI
jgi:hypothetical protein